MLIEDYKGYRIEAIQDEDTKIFSWYIYQGDKFILRDEKTANGDRLQSLKHCINDAKFNVDSFIRLGV